MPKRKTNAALVVGASSVAAIAIIVVAFVVLNKPSDVVVTNTNTTTNTIKNTNAARNTNTAKNTNVNKNINSVTNANANINGAANANVNSNTNAATNVNTNTTVNTNTNQATNTNTAINANTNTSSAATIVKNTSEVEVDAEGNKTRMVDLYMVSLEDESGIVVGCGDSAVPVRKQAQLTGYSTQGSVWAATAFLISLHNQSQYGYYNALYQSTLEVENVSLVGGVASVYLTGTMMTGGTCDIPRMKAQLEYTAMQFPEVSSAKIYINGKSIDEVLSLR